MTLTEYKLAAGELEAVFLPDHGMLGASLKHRGEELLRRVEDLEAAAAQGIPVGIPLMYPWANRLAVARYRTLGRDVTLDPSSPLLLQERGLLIHGVRWPVLVWDVLMAKSHRLVAHLDWDRPELLEVFPFRHQVQMAVTLGPDNLTIEMTISAQDQVPVSFGFHPYFGIPGVPREEWHLKLPLMKKLLLDDQWIPNGREELVGPFDCVLGDRVVDAGYAVLDEHPVFSLSGVGHRISVELLENYRYAQIYAPKSKDYVALEPMTAPTNALISGQGLRVVEAGEKFQAAFRIRIQG